MHRYYPSALPPSSERAPYSEPGQLGDMTAPSTRPTVANSMVAELQGRVADPRQEFQNLFEMSKHSQTHTTPQLETTGSMYTCENCAQYKHMSQLYCIL